MANINVTKNPYKVVAADTNENILVLPTSLLRKLLGGPVTVLFIEVVTGTFRFSVGQAIESSADEPTYTTGAKFPVTVADASKLRFKANAASDAFNISY